MTFTIAGVITLDLLCFDLPPCDALRWDVIYLTITPRSGCFVDSLIVVTIDWFTIRLQIDAVVAVYLIPVTLLCHLFRFID